MDAAEIARQKSDIEERFGNWTAHNVDLGQGVYTIDAEQRVFQTWADFYLRAALDMTGKPFQDLRVLDLACLEGGFALEFARRGAEAVGIEIRQANIEKALFAKRVLELEHLTFVCDDVRNLSAEKFGTFDVVVCSGILYHLDSPDVFEFLRSIGEVCDRVAIIDTHYSLASDIEITFDGATYAGRKYPEHPPASTAKEKQERLWASIDNVESFWLTPDSLFQALRAVGFTSVYQSCLPSVWKLHDRSTFVAIKGPAQHDLAVSEPVSKRQFQVSGAYQRMVKSVEDLEELRVAEIEQWLRWNGLATKCQSAGQGLVTRCRSAVRGLRRRLQKRFS